MAARLGNFIISTQRIDTVGRLSNFGFVNIRFKLLLVVMFCLPGCTTYPFEELVEQGQEKKQFIEYMRTFGFGQYESIYFNQQKGVEILIPKIHFHEHYSWKSFKFSD